MSDIEIRSIRDEELPAWSEVMGRTFFIAGVSGEEMATFRRRRMLPGDIDRMLGAFDGTRAVGSFRSFGAQLTLPGGATEPVAAVTNVAVLTTHHRRGILNAMMTRDLRADADRGEVAAILIASEWPIYGRYGYGPATEHATWTFDSAKCAFATPLESDVAAVEAIAPSDAESVFPAIYEVYRRSQPGEIDRRPRRWDVDLGLDSIPGEPAKPPWLVLHRDRTGTPDGFLRYRVEDHYEERVPAAIVTVEELISTNAEAEAALWRHAFDIDLASTIRARDRRPNEPVAWRLADARAAKLLVRADFLWLRPLDTRRLLEARGYATEGRVVLEVVDADGFAGGRFELDASPGGGRCVRTDRAAQLRLPAGALGSIVLGGVPIAFLEAAGRLDVLDRSVLGVADAIFRSPIAPFCSTWF